MTLDTLNKKLELTRVEVPTYNIMGSIKDFTLEIQDAKWDVVAKALAMLEGKFSKREQDYDIGYID
jgi:hypothetical protein